MSSTRSIRQNQIEVGVIEHEGREFAAFGASVCGRNITAYLKQHHGRYQLTTWAGGTMLASRSEIVKRFWSGELALMFRLTNKRFIVGYALGEQMLFRGQLIDNCTVDEARDRAWTISDDLAQIDLEDEEAAPTEV